MRWRARHTLQDKKLFDGGAAESIFYAHKRKTFKYSCVQAEVQKRYVSSWAYEVRNLACLVCLWTWGWGAGTEAVAAALKDLPMS